MILSLFCSSPLSGLSNVRTECVIPFDNACLRPALCIRAKRLLVCGESCCRRQYQYELFEDIREAEYRCKDGCFGGEKGKTGRLGSMVRRDIVFHGLPLTSCWMIMGGCIAVLLMQRNANWKS